MLAHKTLDEKDWAPPGPFLCMWAGVEWYHDGTPHPTGTLAGISLGPLHDIGGQYRNHPAFFAGHGSDPQLDRSWRTCNLQLCARVVVVFFWFCHEAVRLLLRAACGFCFAMIRSAL